jgi:hypothetical protein
VEKNYHFHNPYSLKGYESIRLMFLWFYFLKYIHLCDRHAVIYYSDLLINLPISCDFNLFDLNLIIIHWVFKSTQTPLKIPEIKNSSISFSIARSIWADTLNIGIISVQNSLLLPVNIKHDICPSYISSCFAVYRHASFHRITILIEYGTVEGTALKGFQYTFFYVPAVNSL